MSTKAHPEAVVLGTLFDFAGHLRTSDIINPLSGIDGFAKMRNLEASEIPTMTWREQLDTLTIKPLPNDSELVADLLLLAEAFKDADPSADNHVFDVLNNAALRLRQLDEQAKRPATYCGRAFNRGHGCSDECGVKSYGAKPDQCDVCAGKDLEAMRVALNGGEQ